MKPILLALAVVTTGACAKETTSLCASCQDGGSDSRVEVGQDLGLTAPDAMLDGSGGELAAGEWATLIDEPRCRVSYVYHPKDPIGLTWLPCRSGRLGCETADVAYARSANKQQALFGRHREPVDWHSGVLRLQLSKGIDVWGSSPISETIIFEVSSGAIAFALREEFGCGAGLDIRAAEVALNLSGPGPIERSRIVPKFGVNSLAKLTVQPADKPFAFITRGENDILLSSGGAGAITNAMLLPNLVTCGAIESETHLAGDVFLSTRYVADVLSLVEVKCPATVAVDAPNTGKTLIGYAIDRTENTLAWVEGTRDATGKIINKELWAAPILATTVDRDKKRKVANVSSVMSYMAAGFGRVLLAADTTKAQLVRLSDGKILEFDAESDFWFSRPLVVEKDRIWLSTGGADSRGPFFSGAVRMKYEFK